MLKKHRSVKVFIVFIAVLSIMFIERIEAVAAESVPTHKVEASSYYKSSKYGTDGLHPNNLVAEKSKFGGWISDLNQWQNCWIDFYFHGNPNITGVAILNGFIEYDKKDVRDDYYYHLRPRKIQIIPNGMVENSIYIELADSKGEQLFKLNFTKGITKLRIVILSVYRESPDNKIKALDVVGLRRVLWLSH